MHTQHLSQPASNENWIIVFFLVASIIITSLETSAQSLNPKSTFNEETTKDCNIELFTAKKIDDKLYVKLLILENKEETNYILESSLNGKNFSPIELKKGHKSPNNKPLLHCYLVDLNNSNHHLFRIRRSSSEGTLYTKTLEIDNKTDVLTQKEEEDGSELGAPTF